MASQSHKSRSSSLILLVLLTCFSAFLLCATWGAVYYQINTHEQQALATAESDMQKLAGAYQQYLLRTIRNYDAVAKFLKYEFESSGGRIDIDVLLQNGLLSDPAIVLASIANEHGQIVASTRKGGDKAVNVSDREHFRVHKDNPGVGLYIGKPVVGRVSNTETVQLTRRLNYPDGRFAGVVVISDKPSVFTDFYNDANLGADGLVSVMGQDGEYRAVRIGDQAKPMTRQLRAMLRAQEGPDDGKSDILPRISASRVIGEYGLIGTVAISEASVRDRVQSERPKHVLLGGVVTLAVLLFYVLSVLLTHRLQKRQAHVEYIADHDPLTTLPNRVVFQRLLEAEIGPKASAGTGVGVLFIDLDNFKNINDSLGHDVGDAFLAAVAGRLRSAVRQTDNVCRFGGDEFTVIVRDCLSPELAEATARRILQGLREPFVINGKRLVTGASIGISLYPHDGASAGELIRHADIAMYKAKSEGKNDYRFFSEKLSVEFTKRVATEQAISEGIDNNEFFLEYQPKIDMASRRIIGLEALVRWQKPNQGVVSPADFIPIAESTGLILPLSKIVLDSACFQMRRWHEAGLGWIPTAINISAYQFRKGRLVEEMQAALVEYGIPPHTMEIELTESLVMDDPDAAALTIQELKRIGVKVSIDDFGTGHSSLGSLMRFSADYLKIDRSFIQNSQEHAQSAAIIRAIIALAKSYNMDVVAEGVETAAQHDMLNGLACKVAQGYLYSRPVAAERIPALLTEFAGRAQNTTLYSESDGSRS